MARRPPYRNASVGPLLTITLGPFHLDIHNSSEGLKDRREWKLERQGKQAILDTVESALHNEESYQILSQEARREGFRRSE